tara:strand:+ start:25832 stop:25987 length:156 start_codon:yes stop_codon:yes gene_type:complete
MVLAENAASYEVLLLAFWRFFAYAFVPLLQNTTRKYEESSTTQLAQTVKKQ